MQVLEIWNNLFIKGLQIHSNFFYHICFLYFVNFKKKSKFDVHLYKFDEI
jgi:hypothetical protein